MPDSLDVNGLQVRSRADLIDELLNGGDGFLGFRGIYGADINVDPNTPDGQLINLLAQAGVDVRELIVQVYNSMDPDQAIGPNLDLRCAINGVVRKPGTRSTQLVTVTVSQALTLAGLDTSPDNPFTISDSSGNQFQLVTTAVFGAAGSQNLTFQAATIGAVIVAPNTLTNIVTVTLGVTSVTNGVLAGTIGTNEESDAALRIRRAKSVALPSKGFANGLRAGLLAINDVTSVLVLENITNAVDANGIPGHSIWVVVAGGTDQAIAEVIYTLRGAGCGMKGGVSVNITQEDGTIFEVLFDRPTPEDLWIKVDVAAITGPAVDANYLRNQILANFTYDIGQAADASAITAFVKSLYPQASVSNCQVSTDDVVYQPLLATTAVNNQWATAAARIYVNGSHG
jgi:uncharacterized phage protein gp47/JayE